jgi:hypothetical protein
VYYAKLRRRIRKKKENNLFSFIHGKEERVKLTHKKQQQATAYFFPPFSLTFE